MKKIYLLGLVLGTSTMMFAQSSSQLLNKVVKNHKPISQDYHVQSKALGDTIWQDYFDTPGTWTIDNDGQTGPAVGWDINTAYDGWAAFGGPVAAPGGGNFAELGNGTDPNAVVGIDVEYTMTTANPIDIVALGGSQQVSLEFLQFGARFNDAQEVQISTDGTTFTTVYDNSGKEVLSSTGGSEYANPDQVIVNLSDDLPANPTSVWIRFKWTTAFPGNTTNGAWITYGWMVDNVQITTPPDNDISTSEFYFGSEGLHYYQIPEAQIAPIDFTVNASNEGLFEQKSVALTATEAGAGFNGTSGGVDIPAGTTDSLVVSTQFTPGGQGSYDVAFAIENDSIDDIPSNNQLDNYSFTVGQDIYARDNDTPSGAFAPDMDFEAGNLYDIWQAADLTGIDVRFGSGLDEAGLETFARVYSIDPNDGSFVLEQETPLYNTQSGDAGAFHTFVFENPVNLQPGTYLVAVGSFATGMSVSTAGASADQTTFLYGDLGSGGIAWYFANSTVQVRMNFQPDLSVESNEVSNLNVSQNFPNPFSNETTVEYSLENASEVSYTVVDLAGNTILDVNEGNVSAGQHSITIDGASLANGVYYFNMTAGDAQTTHKMIVNK